jgi:hypothetical protein
MLMLAYRPATRHMCRHSPDRCGGLIVEVLRHEPLVALLPVIHPLATQVNEIARGLEL